MMPEGPGWVFDALSPDQIDDSTLDAVLGLYEEGFDHWPLLDPGVGRREHLRWKLEQPGVDLPLVLCRAPDGGTAMTITVTARRFHLGGEAGLMRNYPDMVVGGAYRKQGIGRALQDFLESLHVVESDLALYDTEHEGLLRGARSQGARAFANPVRSLVLPLRIGGWMRSASLPAAVRLAAWPLGLALRTRRAWRGLAPASRAGRDFEVRGIERFDSRLDALWQASIESFDLLFERSREFLNWRYCDPRGGPFSVRQAEAAGRVLGYAVLRVLDGQGFIADLLCLPGRQDVLHALVADAIDELRGRDVHSILVRLARSHPYARCLRRAGFWSAPRAAERPLYRAVSDRLRFDRLSAPTAAIHLTYGDADWF